VAAAAVGSGLCDVIMFPVGPFVDARYITEVLPSAREHNVGTIGFKAFGAGKLLGDTKGYGQPLENQAGPSEAPALPHLSVRDCISYTLTCDPDVALLGLSSPEEQDAAFAAASTFSSLNEDDMDAIRARASQAVEGKGECWWNP
jgi:aryl-alcohol dehydrogenase-like predicted oxidoreductase